MEEGWDRWRKLEVWKKADDLAYQIYQLTKKFPKEEIYGITSQLRRAALSIPTNIITADYYAEILSSLKKAGTSIPTNDIWIVAAAFQHGLKLFTKDARHSGRSVAETQHPGSPQKLMDSRSRFKPGTSFAGMTEKT